MNLKPARQWQFNFNLRKYDYTRVIFISPEIKLQSQATIIHKDIHYNFVQLILLSRLLFMYIDNLLYIHANIVPKPSNFELTELFNTGIVTNTESLIT
jgi:hypothetical protein